MQHLLGKVVAPLRRTPRGILSLQNLDLYADYLVAKESGKGEEDADFVALKESLRPQRLLPSQFAFCNRLGLNGIIEDEKWVAAFYPKGFSLDDTQGESLYRSGLKALSFFSREFVAAKWPNASHNLQVKLSKLYGGSLGVVGLGRQHGLEKCITNILGINMEPIPLTIPDLNISIRHLVFPRERHNLKNTSEEQKNEYMSWTMTAVIGAMMQNSSGHFVRDFLDNRLFSAVCRVKDVLESEHPVIELEKMLKKDDQKRQLKFKLLGESGRLSNDSMYVIGVYESKDDVKLGEGFGQSILVAQKRSCLDALRKIYLQEQHPLIRRSDQFTSADYERILSN